jgi:hypothetical protein
MDEMAEPRGLRGYLAGQNDGPGGETMPECVHVWARLSGRRWCPKCGADGGETGR